MRVLLSEDLMRQVDDELAVPAPERMVHVLGRSRPDGSVLLTHGLVDGDADSGDSHVRASGTAETLIAQVEADQGVQYMGVLHSHPAGVIEPSEQDRHAVSDLLRINPHMRAAIVGVVVGHRTSRSSAHVARLPHGELSVHAITRADSAGLLAASVTVVDEARDFWSGCHARLPDGALAAVNDRHVLLIGAGSVGSVVAEQLVRAGVPRLTIVDPDVVEAVNLSRTSYRHKDIGRPKVEALREILASINPDVHVRALSDPMAPGTLDRFAALARDADLVLGLADDSKAMSILDVLLHETETPGVFAGVYRGGSGGDITVVLPGLTACWRCTVGPRQDSDLLPGVDYSTGRLAGAVALGADVSTISVLTARTALGVLGALAGTDPLLDQPIQEGANFTQIGLAPGFFEGALGLHGAASQPPWQSLWARGQGDPECPECGDVTRHMELVQRTPDSAETPTIAEVPPVGSTRRRWGATVANRLVRALKVMTGRRQRANRAPAEVDQPDRVALRRGTNMS